MDEGVALSALRNVATQTENIHKDMRLNPSKYATYTEMRTRLTEYAGALEIELQVQNRKNVGSLNVLTPRKKRDAKFVTCKDMTKDK